MSAMNNGLVFFDGFDDWATADSPGKWTSASGITISSGNGRNSTASARFGSGSVTLSKTLTSQAKRCVGFAFKTSALAGSPLAIQDVTTTQVDLLLNGDGTLSVRRGGSTVLGTTSFALSINTYYYIELLVTIDPSAGTYDLHINGISRLSGTGANTRQSTNSSSNVVRLQGVASTTYDVDDVYVCEGANTAFLGDVKVLTARPTGDGNYSTWTPNSGTTHYDRVNQTTPDGDTTYNEGTATGRDSYLFGSTGAAGTIYGVQVNAWAKNTDATSTNFKLFSRISGTDYDGGVTQSPNTSYAWFGQVWENSPATAAAGTAAEIAEFGVNRTL